MEIQRDGYINFLEGYPVDRDAVGSCYSGQLMRDRDLSHDEEIPKFTHAHYRGSLTAAFHAALLFCSGYYQMFSVSTVHPISQVSKKSALSSRLFFQILNGFSL
jgi:hypothetical protein